MLPWIALGLLAGQPVVAVFEIEDGRSKNKTDAETLHQLTEYLSGQVAEGKGYRVVPTDAMRRVLLEQKKDSYQQCFDEACQVEIGKSLAAEKSLSTKLIQLGSSCILKSVLFDLAKEVSEQVATVKGGCSVDELTSSVEKLALKLKSTGSTGVCAPAETCYRMGIEHRDGSNGRARDLGLAQAHLQEGCDLGHGPSCTDLGFVFEKGELLPKDLARAAKLYLRGCDLGNGTGCTNSGYLHEKGSGLPEDPKLAVKFYQKGCDLKNARGCTNLGYMYRNGSGVEQDLALAVRLYKQGCDMGNAGGCTNLGYMFETGQGVRQDLRLAVRLYRKGCDGGSGVGCASLGSLHESGQGVGRDAAMAAKLYKKACDAGSERGCDALQRLNGS
jgi:TPR repeat protein